MSDVCQKCGMPKDICVCEELVKEKQKIKISADRRKFGRYTTTITGFDKDIDIVKLAKEFKNKLACGGTVKENCIILQGDHKGKVKNMLLEMNYNENQIDLC